MEEKRQKQLLSDYAEKYRRIEPPRKEILINNVKQRFNKTEPIAKRQKLARDQKLQKVRSSQIHKFRTLYYAV